MKIRAFDLIKTIFISVLGMGIYSIGIICFTAPKQIVAGGFTAIAMMIFDLTGLSIGLGSLLLNIPVLIIAYKMLNREFVINTVIGVIASSLTLDYISLIPFVKNMIYTGDDAILAAIFGGVIMGVGLAIMGQFGLVSGGVSTIGVLLKQKNPQFQIGRMILIVNMIIIGLSIIVYGRVEAALYGIICTFTSSSVMDSMLYGMKSSLMIFIISEKSEEIKTKFYEKLRRGMTLLNAEGGWNKNEKNVILCVVAKNEYVILKNIVMETDDAAFIISAEAGEVVGRGFTSKSL